MKILYYECFAGISGDMNLAAMVDLGVEPEYLQAELSKLGLDQEFELRLTPQICQGIRGTRADVVLRNQPDHEHDHCHEHSHEHTHEHDHEHCHEHEHSHDHGHTHEHEHTHCHEHDHAHEHEHEHDHEHEHEHSHDHGHTHEHGHTHGPHRNLADIAAIIRGSSLPEQVQDTSLKIFTRLAKAEAHVHGKPLDEVHFHEVGATDSIVDIVGAAICFHRLGVDAVWAAPVELGGGFIRCAHGIMPVPAPATAEILQGVPTTRGNTPHEATTPTGAAIVSVLAERFTSVPSMVTHKTAYGIGHRETELPNVLRVHLAEAESEERQRASLLQCNIDDMTAETLGAVMDLLMENGAQDVHFTPIMMKKNRPATGLSVLCAEADVDKFKELIFRHTTTLGIKSFAIEKTTLETGFESVETPLGPVTVKKALLNGELLRSKPEFEECRTLARSKGIPLTEVYALVEKHKKH